MPKSMQWRLHFLLCDHLCQSLFLLRLLIHLEVLNSTAMITCPSPDPCYFHLTEPRWHPGDLWQSFSLIDWQLTLLALFQVGHLLRAGRTEGAMCASNLLWPLPAAPSCLWMDPFDKPSQKSPTVVHAWGCEGVSVSICIWRDWQNDSKIQFSCPVFFWSFFPHFNWVYAVFFSLGSLLLLCFGIIISAFHW